jgi:hypothetical protein
MGETDKHGLFGVRGILTYGSIFEQCGQKAEREAGAEGSGFPCVCHLLTRGVRH